jgi:hypothetical protein
MPKKKYNLGNKSEYDTRRIAYAILRKHKKFEKTTTQKKKRNCCTKCCTNPPPEHPKTPLKPLQSPIFTNNIRKVEPFRNRQVIGSSPIVGSSNFLSKPHISGALNLFMLYLGVLVDLRSRYLRIARLHVGWRNRREDGPMIRGTRTGSLCTARVLTRR